MNDKIKALVLTKYGKKLQDATTQEVYFALLEITKQMMSDKQKLTGDKKVYYISSEFLIGKLLSNNLINLGIFDEVKTVLEQAGHDISKVEVVEPEPSLGNGGLGRLAACFLDSIATLGIPGDGISILYHYGLFKQEFENLKQVEKIDPWITKDSWLRTTSEEYQVVFSNKTLIGKMYEIDVVGYKNGINKLKLFDVPTIDESIIEKGITFDKGNIEKNISLFLYPDDSDKAGHYLRIYQQYFMVSCGAQHIISEAKKAGQDLRKLNDHVVIQINDTHPALVIPELIRLLMIEGIEFKEAVLITKKTCAYTNHTILAEALEKWPLDYLLGIVPNIVEIIKDLNQLVKDQYEDKDVAIIDESNCVHMAHLCIHYSFSVNGVAALHTKILKASELKKFNQLYPDKFNNKTNGITFRRWLLHVNPELTVKIEQLIGDGFKLKGEELEKLLAYKEDKQILKEFAEVKKIKKLQLKQYIETKEGIVIDENSIFDIQVKRLHEYKRQQMNVLYIINKILDIRNGKFPTTPITFIFGAKAAPAYTIAKDIIHLMLILEKLINNDEVLSKYIKIVLMENYNVTVAEKLFPACDVSEQISLASKEASGTGNMKFMLNGAVTLGTSDGANVEIEQLVGEDNIYTFGKDSDTIIELYKTKEYNAKKLYDESSIIKQAVDFIISDELLAIGDSINLHRLYDEILGKDWFMTLIDLEDYIKVKEKTFKDYEDVDSWNAKSFINIAKAGFFSSDRTINSYNKDIWKIK